MRSFHIERDHGSLTIRDANACTIARIEPRAAGADLSAESAATLLAAAPKLLKYAKAFEQLITRESDDLGFHLKLANACIEDVEGLRRAIAEAEGRP